MIYAKAVVRAEVGSKAFFICGKYFNDHVALIGRFLIIVLEVPAEGLEERVEEVDADLGLVIVPGKVVLLVPFELFD